MSRITVVILLINHGAHYPMIEVVFMKSKIKLTGLMLALFMLVWCKETAFAEDETFWSITIPKYLEINNETGVCDYELSCSGVELTKILEVTPDNSFTLLDGSGASLDASVTQEQTQFINKKRKTKDNQAAAGTVIKGSISVADMPVGDWSGNFNFNISYYEDTSISLTDTTLTTSNIAMAEVPTSGDVVIPEIYYDTDSDVFYRITSLGNGLFYLLSESHESMTSVTVPDTVVKIGDACFKSCSALQSVSLPESLSIIVSRAFMDCTSLRSIEIPENVTKMYDATFAGCTSLESVKLPSSQEKLGCSVFYNCQSLKTITIPSDTWYIGEDCFNSCSALQSIEIPNSVTYIGDSAFAECTNITELVIPGSVTSIGENAFSNVKKIINNSSCTDGSPWGALSVE